MTITKYYFNGKKEEKTVTFNPNKTKLFEIEIMVDGLTYSVYHKGGYYTVENDNSILKKTLFSGTVAQCTEFIKKQFRMYNLIFCIDLFVPQF